MFHNVSKFWLDLSLHQQLLVSTFVVLKIVLILLLPLTGDEAYFILWGQQLALGYYDHPPAVGWVLHAMSLVVDNLTWYRSFAFFSVFLISYLLYQLVIMHSSQANQSALWLALAFFVSPISLMFVVTANDTVLVMFSVLGFYFFAKAIHTQKWLSVLLAGLFLGLAFLSKYFAAFMLLGLLAYSLWQWKKLNLKQLAVMVFIVLLAVAENLYFNATHCWNNILFNFFSRTQESLFDIGNVLSFVVMILVLISPLGLWYLFKNRKPESTAIDETGLNLKALVLFASVPLLVILLFVSFTNTVGLHWPLIGVTLLYLLYIGLSQKQLHKLFIVNGYFSIIVALILLIALQWVDALISPSQKHHVALYQQPQQVCEILPLSDKSEMFFTLGYSSQSALAYHCKNDNVHVFASTSKYGREDDKLTNFSLLAGDSLKILVTHKKDIEKVRPYFKDLKVSTLKVTVNTDYYWLEGQNFNFELYLEKVIKPVNEKFYSAPDWFPQFTETEQACGFKRKYNLP